MSAARTKLRVNIFPGVQNLPIFAAEAMGFFEAHGLEVETTFTKSSEEQRASLAAGTCDFAHSAVDNALALADSGIDVAIVVGLDHGFNKLIVRPEIEGYEALRGKTLGVDAPDTAFALLAYEVLKRNSLYRDRDYDVQVVGATQFRLEALKQGRIDFAMLNLPFNLFAQESGLKVLDDPIDLIGPYQATGGFVRRDWSACHRDALTRYLASYVKGLRWARDPANRRAVAILLQQKTNMPTVLAARCCELVCDPVRGFAVDARIDAAGMDCVVTLRDSFSPKPDGIPRLKANYLDETFYDAAIATL